MNVYPMPYTISGVNPVWMNGVSPVGQQQFNLNLLNTQNTYQQSTNIVPVTMPTNVNLNHSTNFVVQHNNIILEDGTNNLNNEDSEMSTPSFNGNDLTTNVAVKVSAGTQTDFVVSKKIKPIRNPALKLKTPIAYDKKTDLSAIPILKEGMGVCESCGAIGVKDSFYSKSRKFCSMSCSRNYSSLIESHQRSILNKLNKDQEQQTDGVSVYADFRFEFEPSSEDFEDFIVDGPLPTIESHYDLPDAVDKIEIQLKSHAKKRLADSHSWDNDLNDDHFKAASVSCFRHAPGFEVWDAVLPGIKIEVDANELNEFNVPVIWVATVIKIFGYKALLRYEGLESNSTHDFWLSVLSHRVHHVGWAASKGKPLTPPRCLLDSNKDWRSFLTKRLTNSTTLPVNFFLKIVDSLKCRFNVGQHIEVIDKTRLSVIRLAVIREIIGKRLHLNYSDGSDDDDDDYWCHEDSPNIHPMGWAAKIGHPIFATSLYSSRLAKKNDQMVAPESAFKVYQIGTNINLDTNPAMQVGMKLEVLDPWNIAFMGVATVQKILKSGFIMISVDTYDVQREIGSDWFCYHIHSPYVFPIGYSEKNHLPLHPPFTYENQVFNWAEYLKKTHSFPVPEAFFKKWSQLNHRFTVDMKIEAVDLMTPRLVCVATIADVKGRHLKVTFDGWGDDYDQWIDCSSSEIYPVGWSEVVGYRLESPKTFADKDAATTNTVTSDDSVTQSVKQSSGKQFKKRGRKRKSVSICSSSATSTQQTSVPSKKTQLPFDFVHTSDSSSDSVPLTRSQIRSADQITVPTVQVAEYLDETAFESSPMITTVNKPFLPCIIDTFTAVRPDDNLDPDTWSAADVAEFLKINDCAQYSDEFINNGIDGVAFLAMKYVDIQKVTNKAGPSMKIRDLIDKLTRIKCLKEIKKSRS